MGACFALVYGIKPNALPQEVRRLPLGSGLTVTCTIPLPILNTTPPGPAPDLAGDSQTAGRAWHLWGLPCKGSEQSLAGVASSDFPCNLSEPQFPLM